MTALEFCSRLRTELQANSPYDENKKKKKRPHMRDIAFNNVSPINEDMAHFFIGSEQAELQAPQYHILNDAKYIHFPYKGTKKSKGSQARVVNRAERDYGRWVEKTGEGGTKRYAQEYRGRNYRGSRGNIDFSVKQNFYENKHYNYIDDKLSIAINAIAGEAGGYLNRKYTGNPVNYFNEALMFDLLDI